MNNYQPSQRVHLHGLSDGVQWREIATGRAVARFTLRTADNYVNAHGLRVTDREAHTVVAWGTMADEARRHLAQGTAVAISGRTVQRTYSCSRGKVHQVCEIIMEAFTLLPRAEQ